MSATLEAPDTTAPAAAPAARRPVMPSGRAAIAHAGSGPASPARRPVLQTGRRPQQLAFDFVARR